MTHGYHQAGALQRFLYHWFRQETVVRALKVAGVVGPILTVINQYDLLLRLEFSPRLFAKILLTFLVPYSVSSFSSARAYMESETQAELSRTQDKVGAAAPGTYATGDACGREGQ
ncbi:MAG: nitrate/nitrite transporter NrtS [Thermodesulfobacteriota bacterium]